MATQGGRLACTAFESERPTVQLVKEVMVRKRGRVASRKSQRQLGLDQMVQASMRMGLYDKELEGVPVRKIGRLKRKPKMGRVA